MQELQKNFKEKKSLYDRAQELRPQFSDNTKALEHFINELELISKKFGISIDELIQKAEHQQSFDEDLMYALSLSRKIQVLKNDKK